MFVTVVPFLFKKVAVMCDGNCKKAWGIGLRPKNRLSDDDENWEWLADHELGEAPSDPGTSDGGFRKPQDEGHVLNKWCIWQCERAVFVEYFRNLELPDFSKRIPNRNERLF